MKNGRDERHVGYCRRNPPVIHFSRPLHGLTKGSGSKPSSKLLGYFHSSASRTRSRITDLNDLLAKVRE
jgi:hypothetical protein